MNCEEFEILVGDLASDHLMSAVKRRRALSHTYGCESCEARLANERALNAALRVTASGETERAPARVRAALLEAFADQRALSASSMTPSAAKLRLRARLVWAAAAAAVILFAVISLQLIPRRSGEQAQLTPGTSNKAAIPDEPRAGAKDMPAPNESVTEEINRPAQQKPRHLNHHVVARSKASDDSETDFIPLTYVADASALRSGQVVHVRVPRSTLISMGLAMNVDHANDLVEADLLLSDEGVAHGIRLHQQSRTTNQ
ncbi:MAG TPA: hypothetical protein VKF81_11165 [Blastocatellia bacterium]|nr:hypothetical protein [Blastocatellia bacterium]